MAPKFIKADQIVAIGGLTNSLCDAVVEWLQANLPCFKSIRTTEPLAKGGTADVGRALEESLGVIDLKTMRARYVANMRAYMDELITDERCILGTRKGNVQWTKLEERKDAETMTTKVQKATTNYDNWFIRQMLRGVETICAVTEFAPADELFLNTVMLYQVLMADHEEEILNHLKTLDYTDPDIGKAYTLFPYHQAIHKLDNKNELTAHQFVPEMFADVIVALATHSSCCCVVGFL